jgi:hypothetical protein
LAIAFEVKDIWSRIEEIKNWRSWRLEVWRLNPSLRLK